MGSVVEKPRFHVSGQGGWLALAGRCQGLLSGAAERRSNGERADRSALAGFHGCLAAGAQRPGASAHSFHPCQGPKRGAGERGLRKGSRAANPFSTKTRLQCPHHPSGPSIPFKVHRRPSPPARQQQSRLPPPVPCLLSRAWACSLQHSIQSVQCKTLPDSTDHLPVAPRLLNVDFSFPHFSSRLVVQDTDTQCQIIPMEKQRWYGPVGLSSHVSKFRSSRASRSHSV